MKTIITKEKFLAYYSVQKSGVTNMFDVQTVSDYSGLDRSEILDIIKNYSKYKKQFVEETVQLIINPVLLEFQNALLIIKQTVWNLKASKQIMNEIKIVRIQLLTDSEILLEDCENIMLSKDDQVIFAADIARFITKVQKFLKLTEFSKVQSV